MYPVDILAWSLWRRSDARRYQIMVIGEWVVSGLESKDAVFRYDAVPYMTPDDAREGAVEITQSLEEGGWELDVEPRVRQMVTLDRMSVSDFLPGMAQRQFEQLFIQTVKDGLRLS